MRQDFWQGLVFTPQSDCSDLGERMGDSMRQAFLHGADKVSALRCSNSVSVAALMGFSKMSPMFRNACLQVLLVGSDIPDLSAGILREAFSALENAQVRF